MRKYEPHPTNGKKSFYGKAVVEVDDNGNETLFSYGTAIIRRNADGSFTRLYNGTDVNGQERGYTATTMTHLKAFCGMSKKDFLKLEV